MTGGFAPAARRWVVVGLHTLALAVALLAWSATRGESQPDDQIPWIVLASLAAALSGAVNAGWLLLSRREVGHRHQSLSARIVALHGASRMTGDKAPGAGAAGGLVAVEGSKLFHRSGCALVDGRPAAMLRPSDGAGRGHQPCGWCRP